MSKLKYGLILLLCPLLFISGFYYARWLDKDMDKSAITPVSKEVSTIDSSELKQSEVKSPNQELMAESVQSDEADSHIEGDHSEKAVSPSHQGKKVRLDVTPQIQGRWNTCAPTTVSMLLSYKGITVSQNQLAHEMLTDETFGTHNSNAVAVLNQHLFGYSSPSDKQAGYRLEKVISVEAALPLFKQRLMKNIDEGYPVYLTFDVSHIYPGKSGEHNVLATGYQLTDDGTDVSHVYFLDPSYTVQDPVYGGLKKVTPEALLTAMLPCVEPEYAW